MNGCTFTGNTANRVLLQPGAMMGHNATLTAQPVLEGYEFREDFTVPPTVTLTLEPGVTLMGGNMAAEFVVEGHLEALGTPTQPITFTSATDSGSNQWTGLAFDGSAGLTPGGGTGHLRHATIRYAGRRNRVTDALVGPYDHSNLAIRNGTLRLEHVAVRDIATGEYDYGLIASDSHLIISETLFTGIGNGQDRDVPMRLQGVDTVLEMSGCTFTDNTSNRVLLDPDAMMGHDATLTAQPVLEGYEFRDDFTVPSMVTLTLEPGVTLMGGSIDAEFLVEGHLEALGTPTQPITFTSAVNTGSNQWPGLAFDGGSGQLRHATIRYAGRRNRVTDALVGPYDHSNLAVRNGMLRLEQVTVCDIATGDYDYGLIAADSHLILSDTLFTGIGNGQSRDIPLRLQGADTVLEMSGCTFTDNTNNRVLLDQGAMMGHDATLATQAIMDGYEFRQDFTVPPTVTLTVEPGVAVMGASNVELLVEGHLDALGTETQPITFTSAANSGASQWAGVVFDGSKGAGTGYLKHATVRYGGHGNSVLSESGDYHSGSNVTVDDVRAGEVRLEHVRLREAFHFDGWHKFGDHGLYVRDGRVAVSSSIIEDHCDGWVYDSGVYVAGDSSVVIEDSLIQSNAGTGLLIEGDAALVKVTGSSIVNNIGDGVRNTGTASVILAGDEEGGNAIYANQGFGVNQAGLDGQTFASYNWWGEASGPTHSGNLSGTGEEVTDRVLYDPWLTEAPTPPAVAAGMVQLASPNEVSVGQTVNIGVLFQQLYTETLKDAILVLEIPWRAEYRYSTHDGQFWPLHNRVIWKLGNVAPGETFEAIAQVRYKWHTPNGTGMPAAAMVAADNLRNRWVTYEDHLAYEELVIASEQELTQGQVDDILANDADLDALFADALAQGFEYYGNATLQILDDGTEWFEMLLIDLDRPGDVLAVRRIGDDRHVRHEADTYVSFYTLSGGVRFDYLTATWESWGDAAPEVGLAGDLDEPSSLSVCPLGDCPHHNWGDCLRNCLINQIPREMSNPSLFAGSSDCAACTACDEFCLDVCSECARRLWESHQHEHYHDCTRECADSSNWNNYQCDDEHVACYDAPKNESTMGRSQYRMTYECDEDTCDLLPEPHLEYCPQGCVVGDTAGSIIQTDCIDCEDVWDFVGEAQCIRALTAHDPNALYGPEVVAPGQTITYTVEWENEGRGIAYGVYVESYLPPELDDRTLEIGGEGVYFPGSRTLMWEIGELGPDQGDTVTYTVQVPASAISGTVIVAEATVYFPSVPETTPTNPVVTLVQDVAAHGQALTTIPGVPLDLTLTGSSPSDDPLSFEIGQEPLNGELTGTPPYLTYTPADGFEGQDWFDFVVSAGGRSSLPSLVTIEVTFPGRIYLPLILRVN